VLVVLVKKSKSYLFDPVQYEGFRMVCRKSGVGVTEAFERFMACCIEADKLVYGERAVAAVEAEARVLVDWLGKGKMFYRGPQGEELNVAGRLFWLLPRVGPVLAVEVEAALKRSVQGKDA
jgi:hypothetical protein